MVKKVSITEREFSQQIEHLFKLFGWEFYHVFEQQAYARRTSRGFPDYVAVRSPRLIFAELKSDKGQLTEPQKRWLENLRACNSENWLKYKIQIPEVYLWRPAEIDDIAGILR